MGLSIITVNKRNEPFDINHINIKEEVLFFYEQDSSTSGLSLDGSEKWIWNFDVNGSSQGTSGVVYDQPIQQLTKFTEPLSTIFYRSGARNVSVEVYDSSNVLKYSDTISFFVFDFPKEIVGADHVQYGTGSNFTIETINNSLPTFKWYVNGQLQASVTNSLTINPFISKSTIECQITNGIKTQSYKRTVIVSVGNSVLGKKYETDVTESLMFFNKEGDNLNFEIVETEDGSKRWEGDMIFHHNSSDTFKTIGLYLLEKVEPISFAAPKSEMILEKFQIFTENGIDFEPKWTEDINIENIVSVNNDPNFYTKWIFANNINLQLPLGSEIYFEDINEIVFDSINPEILVSYSPINDFVSFTSSGLKTFTVIGSKKDAVMVMTATNNAAYTNKYGFGEYRKSNNAFQKVTQGKVKCLNLVKLFDSATLNPEWNEPFYKGLLYDKKKLSIVNSQKNDGVYTFNYVNDDPINEINNKYIKINQVDITDLIPNPKYGFKVDVSFKTNKILLSSGIPVDFLPYSQNNYLTDKNILVWESLNNKDYTPQLLKSGLTFFFEQTDPTHPNLSMLYDCLGVDTARNLLTAQSDDKSGYKLILKDYTKLNGYTFKYKVNNISSYSFTEGKDWSRGANLIEATYNLSQAMINKLAGVSLLVQESEIWIWEKKGYKFTLDMAIDNSILRLQAGILTDNNPKFGIVNDQWVELNDDLYNGYVHQKVDQNIYHVVYFEGSYPNFTPIWYMLPMDKKVVWSEPTFDISFSSNVLTNVYLNDTTLTFEQIGDNDIAVTSEVIAQRFVNKYQKTLQTYGIDLYQTLTDLCFARTYTVADTSGNSDYLDIKFYSDNSLSLNSYLADTSGTAGTNVPSQYLHFVDTINVKEIDLLNVLEDVVLENNRTFGSKEKPKSLSKNFKRKIIVKDIDQKFGFVLTINGIDYPVTFDNVSTSLNSTEDTIVDIDETLKDWGNRRFTLTQDKTPIDNTEVGKKYWEVLESLGVLVWLEKSEESYVQGNPIYDTIVIESKFPNININYSLNGTLDSHKILHSDVEFIEIGSTLTITINRITYTMSYQGSIPATLKAWKEEYEGTLIENEIIVDHFEDSTSGTSFIDLNNNILRFSTLRERTNFSYQVSVGKSATLGKNLYFITEWRTGQQGIIISSNEVNLISGADLQEAGFATGMIMSLKGSQFPLNNQEYNLILVEPTTLGLSYQGAFWSETDLLSHIGDRSGFDWTLYDEQTNSSAGINYINNGKFASSSWWVYNDNYTIFNNKIEVSSNYGFQTPNMQLKGGRFNLKYSSYDAGTSGYYGSQGFAYSPVCVSVFSVSGNTQTLLFQNIQTVVGDFEEEILIPSGRIFILFSNGQAGKYFNIDNVSLEELDYVTNSGLVTLDTREFLRFPRERFDGDEPVQFKITWEEQDEKSIFLYDFSGEQIKLRDEGIYQYQGTYPLLDENDGGYLIDKSNRDLTKLKDPKYQQTIWDELLFNLKLVDSETDINPLPTPMQIFAGYKSLDEGVNKRTMLIHRLENINVTIDTRVKNNISNVAEWVDIVNFDGEKQELVLQNSTLNFIQLGFKKGQKVLITGRDVTSKNNQAVFKNSGFEGIITLVNVNKLAFTPLNKNLKTESTKTTTRNLLAPFREKDASIQINIEVIPQEIARITLRGQTEIEDERFKVQLNNFGFNVNHRDIFIFKEYDINENGIDWNFLNIKRKEMLLMYPQIYNYLGSYKSLVNAINYFGYNDLELYEYYKNIDTTSPHYKKLHKIEIPDIFDSTVAGWTPNDYIIKTLPDKRYEKTKLFNLTYRITDFEGNSVLAYSLDEVITKLLGLKRWLREEVMPIGTRIRDITGRGSTVHTTQLWHDVKLSRKFKVKETLTPIDFKIEGYLQPVENNTRTFNMHLEFFTNSEENKPDWFHLKVTTFAAKPNFEDPNFKLKSIQTINEYRTDFKSYNFAADRNIDPFILIEISCDNGYGATYNIKRTFDLTYML